MRSPFFYAFFIDTCNTHLIFHLFNQKKNRNLPMISNKDGLEHLAQIFIQEGIKDIVISPGSRNAPMMLTFPEYKEFKIYSIIDERSAGFFALGLAQKNRRPVVLNCTSGSALLNYAPAIAEAYYQQIPLIVLSADRPGHLIDQGDGQAIQQQNVYHNYIRKSVHLPENIENKKESEIYQSLVFQALEACSAAVSGPVHINVPLDEPLYGLKKKEPLSLIKYKSNHKAPLLTTDKISALKSIWYKSEKKLIIVGQHLPDDQVLQLLTEMATQDTVVLTETTSNMFSKYFVSHIDQVLTQINGQNEDMFYPDIVISLGGPIVSKKIKAWLRNGKDYQHWHISLDDRAPNTFFHLQEHIQSEESEVLKWLQNKNTSVSKYTQDWKKIVKQARRLHKLFIQQLPYSDLMVFSELQKAIPKGIQLHFANSTPIRYSQFFDFSKAHTIDSNRGVSGIDGSVSTALGQSLASKAQTLLVTGDLSFFYDNNALWNKYIPNGFKILLINNGGGGIFRFIDGPLKSGKIDLFETPHTRFARSWVHEAEMEYRICIEDFELTESIHELLNSSHSQLLEVFTPREINDQVLKDYFKYLIEFSKK